MNKQIFRQSAHRYTLLTLGALGTLIPVGFITPYAIAGTTSSNAELSVDVVSTPTLSITLPSNPLAISITPNFVGGTLGISEAMSVTVGTSNRTGYTLTMTPSTASLNRVEAATDHIAGAIDALAINSSYTESQFRSDATLANKWGYSLESSGSYNNYVSPVGANVISSSNVPTNGVTANIKFAAKVDGTIPSGTYNTTLVFTATTNPALYLQDISVWKDSLAVGQSEQVFDRRDSDATKSYWVTKLETDPNIPETLPGTSSTTTSAGARAYCSGSGASRHCYQIWMTQNLDLALTGTRTYTHADTDLGYTTNNANAVWTPSATMTSIGNWEATGDTSTLCWGSDCSYEYGDKYIFTSGTTGDDTTFNSLSACEQAGHSTTDCQHSHAGNLYNFRVATALSATDTTTPASSTDYAYMPNSICPAGWRLPVGLTAADAYSDFDYLLYKNNVTAGHGGLNVNVGYTTNGFNNLRISPLWFVRSGYAWSGSLYNQGVSADYWSGSVSSSTLAYYLSLNSGVIYPADDGNRAYGFSVRCVAR